jgi:hypothetical protein
LEKRNFKIFYLWSVMSVFSLQEARAEQVKNVSFNDAKFSFWPEGAVRGYYVGGATPAAPFSATIERINFSDETRTLPGFNLPAGRGFMSGVSSVLYGYFGGGNNGSTDLATIERIDFFTENRTTPSPVLTQARNSTSAISGSYYGYFGGGITVTTLRSTIDRLEFSTETVTSPVNDLPIAKSSAGATSTNYYGYFGGGFVTPLGISTIDRLDLSSESFSTPTPKLTQSKLGLSATSSRSYGYFGGGYSTPITTFRSTIDRLDFSTETVTSSPTLTLSIGKANTSAISNFSYGYIAGGQGPVPTSRTNAIDRIDFVTETRLTLATVLSQSKSNIGSTSGGQSTGN